MLPNEADNEKYSRQGWRGPIRGTCVAAASLTPAALGGGMPAIAGEQTQAGQKALNAAGALGPGTYYFFIPCAGADAADIILRPSGSTGTMPTATISRVLEDCITPIGTPTALAAFVAATQQVTSVTSIRGAVGLMLTITVVAASSITFDQASYCAK